MARIGSNTPVLDEKLLKQEVVKKNKELLKRNKYLGGLISDDEKTAKKLEKIVRSLTIDGEHLEGQTKDAKDLLKKQVHKYKVEKKKLKAIQGESKKITDENVKADKKLNSTLKLISKGERRHKELIELNKASRALKSQYKQLENEKDELILYIENLVAEGKIEAKKYTKRVSDAKKKHDAACVLLDKEGADLAEATKIMREGHEALKADLDATMKASVKKIAEVTAYTKRETQSVEDSILDLKGESAAIQSEINESMAKLNIERQNLADMEEAKELAQFKTQQAKDDYEKFKVKCFEEIAALKLRGKLDKIDKAGLSDVFNQ